MSQTYTKLKADITTAMKARSADLGTLRDLSAAIYKRAKDDLVEVTEPLVLGVIEKGIKQRIETIEACFWAVRPEMQAKEEHELEILRSYLPAQLTAEEIESIIDAAIAQVGAVSVKDMGAVNKIIMPQVKGKADGKAVSEIVKSKLTM